MKALIRLVVVVVILGGAALYFYTQYNHSSFTPQTVDLAVDCSDLDNILVTSTVNVSVQNLSTRSHNDISVKIRAYDESGKLLKEKFTTFSRTLPAKGFFDKPVTLPAETKRCDCKIVSSHPVN
jgi:uncharacterized protein YxeA